MENTSTDWRALCAELHAAFNTYAVGEEHHQLLVRAAAALAQSEPKRPTVMEIIALADEVEAEELGQIDLVRRALARWGRPAIEPVPVGDVRYEFIVSDAETDEPQASGEALTLEEAQREGRHYLAMYEEDGPMRLELRRVEVLPHHALPVPAPSSEEN
jgi:hypothetical protein